MGRSHIWIEQAELAAAIHCLSVCFQVARLQPAFNMTQKQQSKENEKTTSTYSHSLWAMQPK